MSESEVYVSLEIGSSSIKCIIGEVVNAETIHVMGVGQEKSAGIKKGSIIDIEATVQSIKKAVNRAERMIQMKVNKVILGIPANQVALQNVKGVVAVNGQDREITDEDLDRVIEAAHVVSLAQDREIVSLIPRQFGVDGSTEISDPRGMMGIRLEMDATLVTASKTVLHNLLRCVEKAGLEIQQIYLQPLASGYYALTEDEKTRGTLFVDMGGETTTVGVFKDEEFTNVAMIPLGGENITKDLSLVLKTSMEQAEQIKLDYGHAFYSAASQDEIFEVPLFGTNSKEQYSQRYISEIISARVDEIFDLVLDELYHQQVTDLPGGIVITGGVAKLEGIRELAIEKFQSRVRLYSPDLLSVRDPEFSSTIGLIRYAYMESGFYNNYSEEVPLTLEEAEAKRPEKKQKEAKEHVEPKKGMMSRIKDMLNNIID